MLSAGLRKKECCQSGTAAPASMADDRPACPGNSNAESSKKKTTVTGDSRAAPAGSGYFT
jgi:hypothetical protein